VMKMLAPPSSECAQVLLLVRSMTERLMVQRLLKLLDSKALYATGGFGDEKGGVGGVDSSLLWAFSSLRIMLRGGSKGALQLWPI
jgi:hypothetical protein